MTYHIQLERGSEKDPVQRAMEAQAAARMSGHTPTHIHMTSREAAYIRNNTSHDGRYGYDASMDTMRFMGMEIVTDGPDPRTVPPRLRQDGWYGEPSLADLARIQTLAPVYGGISRAKARLLLL